MLVFQRTVLTKARPSMHVLNSAVRVEQFFRRARTAPERVLLTAYDGVLAPLERNWRSTRPYGGVIDLLHRLNDHTRIVVVSGRRVSDIRRLLPLRVNLEFWGTHGWEQLTVDGHYSIGVWDRRASVGIIAARECAAAYGMEACCEEKPVGLALHWPPRDPLQRATFEEAALLEEWDQIAQRVGLGLYRFAGGIELRPPGRDKGYAVTSVLRDICPNAAVAYLGDAQLRAAD
jgi:trehalose 6-phosphate phosphatase